jgi:FKBP-type peptidyl-prolyl cis-trans isomerase (trigger factor)
MVDRFLDALLAPGPDAPPETIERAREEYRPAAVRGLQRTLVLQTIAEQADLEATPQEVAARIEQLAARAGRSAAEIRRRLERSGELRELSRRITEEKVFEHLEGLSEIE